MNGLVHCTKTRTSGSSPTMINWSRAWSGADSDEAVSLHNSAGHMITFTRGLGTCSNLGGIVEVDVYRFDEPRRRGVRRRRARPGFVRRLAEGSCRARLWSRRGPE